MQHKLVRAGNSIVEGIKSFRFVEQVNDDVVLRWGTCISSCIEVEAYGSRETAVANGEVLTYYQTVDVDDTFTPLSGGATQDILIGVFTAVASIPSGGTYSFVAYDNISKLDKAFGWPDPTKASVTYGDIMAEIETVCGVSFDYTTISSDLLACTSAYFYAEGLTCRQFVSQIAEASGCFVRCNTSGEIEFARYGTASRGYWQSASNYFIGPTDQMSVYVDALIPSFQNLIPVVYKENGLSFAESLTLCYSKASAIGFGGTEFGAAQKGSPFNNGPQYDFGTNLIVNFLESFPSASYGWDNICNNVLNLSLNYKKFEAHIFPFINPFRAGQIVTIADPTAQIDESWSGPEIFNARHFSSLIMKMEISDSEAVIYCYGEDDAPTSSAAYGGEEKRDSLVHAIIEKYIGSEQPSFVLVETGTFSISAKTSIEATDVEIDFTGTYASPLRIMVVGNNASAAVYGLPALTANSATGATVRLRNTATHGQAATFRWFAIETV